MILIDDLTVIRWLSYD